MYFHTSSVYNTIQYIYTKTWRLTICVTALNAFFILSDKGHNDVSVSPTLCCEFFSRSLHCENYNISEPPPTPTSHAKAASKKKQVNRAKGTDDVGGWHPRVPIINGWETACEYGAIKVSGCLFANTSGSKILRETWFFKYVLIIAAWLGRKAIKRGYDSIQNHIYIHSSLFYFGNSGVEWLLGA